MKPKALLRSKRPLPSRAAGHLPNKYSTWTVSRVTGNWALQMDWEGLARIDVAKSSSHHLSQGEIDGDNPCYQQ
jgi:hypothetical protein